MADVDAKPLFRYQSMTGRSCRKRIRQYRSDCKSCFVPSISITSPDIEKCRIYKIQRKHCIPVSWIKFCSYPNVPMTAHARHPSHWACSFGIVDIQRTFSSSAFLSENSDAERMPNIQSHTLWVAESGKRFRWPPRTSSPLLRGCTVATGQNGSVAMSKHGDPEEDSGTQRFGHPPA
jgi:hypothetical protein